MFKNMRNRTKSRKGFTLMEVLAVIAIIVIVCTIAIPSVFNIQQSLKLKEKDDYAKVIYMAAQGNLLDMRRDNKLGNLTGLPDTVPAKEGYGHVSSEETEIFDLVLPLNSVESTLREQQIIIELNPSTGSVLSVFYCDNDEALKELYEADATGELRTEEKRQELEIGYYYGADLDASELEIIDLQARLHYDNGEKGVLYVDVPLQKVLQNGERKNIFEGQYTEELAKKFAVQLTLQGEESKKTVVLTDYAEATFSIDSVADSETAGAMMIRLSLPLDSLVSEEGFSDQFADFVAGENLTAMAEVKYNSIGDDPLVDVRSAALAGINPLFDALTVNENNKYILSVSNGRHLQNLNLLAPSIAQNVEEVVFVADAQELFEAGEATREVQKTDPNAKVGPEIIIDWNETVVYYNNDAVKEFTPINNAWLLGEGTFESNGTSVNFKESGKADESENMLPNAVIKGNGCKIYNLTVDTTAEFTGLFGYLNTKVENLYVVNPTIKGHGTATGAFAGAAGSKAQFVNCGVYLDTEAEGFDRENHGFGVSGTEIVGGLAGYSQSDVKLSDFDLSKVAVSSNSDSADPLTENQVKEEELLKYVSFYKSFAAVPVSNDAESAAVGAMVGQTNNSNFYACYASGEVTANNNARASGGFVGNSNGSCFSNCFATGNITAKGGAAGGFVGLMNYESTLGGQHTVFSSCYSSGITMVDDTAKENFSGMAEGYGSESGLFSANYYDLLAPQFVNGGTMKYQSPYIYKDSYYLAQTMSDSEDLCASAISYSDLMKLYSGKDAAEKLELQKSKKLFDITVTDDALKALEETKEGATQEEVLSALIGDTNSSAASNLLAVGNVEDLLSYMRINASELENQEGKIFSVNVDVYWFLIVNDDALEKSYVDAYDAAFDETVWDTFVKSESEENSGENTEAEYKTYPYKFYAYEAQYPFSMLKDMDYYGDWPTLTPAVGLAYYEKYDDGSNEEKYGFYFDKAETSTLNNTYTVIEGGYALLAADNISNIKLDETDYPLTVDNKGSVNVGRNYQYILLDDDILEIPEGNNFYSEMEVEVTSIDAEKEEVSKTYTFYYNPLVAISQINPTDGTTSAQKPINAPDEIYIRTARHFYNLGEGMDDHWMRNYVQQRDIDFSTYEDVKEIGLIPIGTFTGIYDGGNHEIVVTKDNIVSGSKDSGLFGTLSTTTQSGETLVGTVKNLTVIPVPTPKADEENASNLKQEYPVIIETGKDVANFGLVVGYNESGIIDNVHVKLNGDVTITPAKDAQAPRKMGLMVGLNGGSLKNSSVYVMDVVSLDEDETANYKDVTITMTATTVGGLAGQVEGCSVEECSILSGEKSDLILRFVDCMNIGGLTGMSAEADESTGSKVADCTVNVDIAIESAGSIYAGGLVGYSQNTEFSENIVEGSITKADVDENQTTVIGGAVGYSHSGIYKNNDSTMEIDSEWSEYAGYTTTNNNETILNPSTFGSVGKFVGHVEDGIFNDCSAIAQDGTNYQFLGTIKAAEVQGPSALYYSYQDLGDEPKISAEITDKLTAMNESDPVPVYNFGGIVLEDCRFDLAKGGEYMQKLGGVYYYDEGAPSVDGELKAQFTGKDVAFNTDSFKDSSDWTLTEYYYLKSNEDSEDLYYRVYSRVENDVISLAIKMEENEDSEVDTDTPAEDNTADEADKEDGAEENKTPNGDESAADDETQQEGSDSTDGDNTAGTGTPDVPDEHYEEISLGDKETITLYTLTIPDGKYLLLRVDDKKPLSNGSYTTSTDFNTYAKNENCIWDVSGGNAVNGTANHGFTVYLPENYLSAKETIEVSIAAEGHHTLYPINRAYKKVGAAQICAVYDSQGTLLTAYPVTIDDSVPQPMIP